MILCCSFLGAGDMCDNILLETLRSKVENVWIDHQRVFKSFVRRQRCPVLRLNSKIDEPFILIFFLPKKFLPRVDSSNSV